MPLYLVVVNNDNSVALKKIESVNDINEIDILTKNSSKFSLRVLPEGVIDLIYQDLVTDSAYNQNAITECNKTVSSQPGKSKSKDYYYPNSPNFGKTGVISKNENTGEYELNGEGVKKIINKSEKYLISYAHRTRMTLI